LYLNKKYRQEFNSNPNTFPQQILILATFTFLYNNFVWFVTQYFDVQTFLIFLFIHSVFGGSKFLSNPKIIFYVLHKILMFYNNYASVNKSNYPSFIFCQALKTWRIIFLVKTHIIYSSSFLKGLLNSPIIANYRSDTWQEKVCNTYSIFNLLYATMITIKINQKSF